MVCHMAMDGKGVFSHRTAAALFQLDGFDEELVEATTTTRLVVPGSVLHRVRSLPFRSRPIAAFRVTTVERTIADLGAVVRDDLVERALEDALRRRMTTLKRLQEEASMPGSMRKPGPALLRQLLSLRDPDHAPTQTEMERLFARIFRNSDLPAPIPQYSIYEQGRFVARPDFAYPQIKLALECFSYRWHEGRWKLANDVRRRRSITQVGWRVLEFVWEEIVANHTLVLDEVRRATFPSMF
jgi:very-short-patch-repair endonuclease